LRKKDVRRMIPAQYIPYTCTIGLWFTVIGYYFLLFIYLALFKWRKDKNFFNLMLALFFITLAIGRVFFLLYDFYDKPTIIPLTLSLSAASTPYPSFVEALIIYNTLNWRIASFWEWLSVSFISLGIAYVWLENKWLRRTLHLPPLFAGVSLLFLPGDVLFGYNINEIPFFIPQIQIDGYEALFWLGFDPFSPLFPTKWVITYQPSGAIYLTINYVLASLYSVFIPLLFFYVAWNSVGVIRRKALLLGIGFISYYVGRTLQAAIIKSVLGEIAIFIAPIIVIVALVLITSGVQYEAE